MHITIFLFLKFAELCTTWCWTSWMCKYNNFVLNGYKMRHIMANIISIQQESNLNINRDRTNTQINVLLPNL